MNSERGIETRNGKHAETFDNAEICRRHDFYSQRTDKHHKKGNRGADTIGTAIFILCARDYDNRKRRDR